MEIDKFEENCSEFIEEYIYMFFRMKRGYLSMRDPVVNYMIALFDLTRLDSKYRQ